MDCSTVMMVATLVMKMLRAVNLVMDCHYSQSLLCHPRSNLQLNATAESMILSNMSPLALRVQGRSSSMCRQATCDEWAAAEFLQSYSSAFKKTLEAIESKR